MWVYLCLMIILALLSCKKGKSNFKILLSGMTLFLLMGLKGKSVGNDTSNYILFFNNMKEVPTLLNPNSRFEYGYQIYSKIIGIFWDYQVLFIITALICIICVLYGIIKNSKNWQYSLFLFVGLRFYYFFLSGLRQSIAVSIIIVAYTFLKQKKIKGYILLVLLASTFHFSALIFLLAWPISKMKFTQKNILKILAITLIIYIFFSPIITILLNHMPDYYSGYLTKEAGSANNIGNYIGTIIPILALLFIEITGCFKEDNLNDVQEEKREEGIKKVDNMDLQLFFLLISAALSFISTKASILDRMVQYYWIFSVITIANAIFSIKDTKKRTVWFLIISSFVILYNITLLVMRPQWTLIIPYKFFWQ